MDLIEVVYGLIALLIFFIIVIIIIDRKESKRKPKNLFDTLNMKIINDSMLEEYDKKSNVENSEVIEINTPSKEVAQPEIKPIDIISTNIEDMDYVETDLDKTQAQIHVEEIKKALEDAKIDEKIEEDKYQKFEEEQEKNAIISYNELKESFDKLYSENEKIQYQDDDTIPINMEELLKLKEELDSNEKIEKVENNTVNTTTTTFKSSPVISPVYGIQDQNQDRDIFDANQFLQNLKELKNNLE